MKILIKIVISLLLLSSVFLNAQEKTTLSLKLRTKKLPFGLSEQVPSDKPVVGLALSGGGARGLAQIGVLKALEEAGIQLDVITGTSMGSIVGGLYSVGYSVDELDTIAMNTDWNDLLTSGKTSRSELFVDQKITDDRALLTLRLDGLTPVIPTSFNDGQKLINNLTLLTYSAPIHSYHSFDDLLYRYRAVSTDLLTGERVVLKEGHLGKAMRASSSVSFFLKPVEWDSLLLVDGGLVENIPVSTAKELGSDIVIAVNTTSPLHSEEEMKYPWFVADQVVSIPMKRLDEKQKKMAEVVIEPGIKEHTATDFTNIRMLINAGYSEAIKKIDVIKNKINSVYYNRLKQNEFYIKNISYDNSQPEELLRYLKKYSSMDSVSSAEIYYDLNNLYNSGKYKNISFEIINENGYIKVKFDYKLNPPVKTISLIGIDSVDHHVVDSVFATLKGKPYTDAALVGRLIPALDYLHREGFILADFIKKDFDASTGNLILYFDMGMVSDIEVTGNYTRKSLVTREIPIGVGNYLDYDKLKTALKNLRSTGFFENVEINVVRKNNKYVLIVYVEEKTSSLLRFGFLVDETYNAQFSLDIRDENIFGSGTEVGMFLFGGASNRAYIFEIKNHRILNTYLTYNISAYYKFSDIDVYENINSPTEKTFSSIKAGEYRQIFYGASVSVGTQIEKFGNLIFTGKYQFDEVKNTQKDPVIPYKTKLVTLKVSTTVDNMDRYPYPLRGLYFTGFYETAQSFLGGDEGFTSVAMDFRYFFRLGKRSTVVPRLMIGFGDNTMPLSEQFLLGGMSSFFGMHENEMRGRQIFLASLMYRIKLPFQIFFDTYLKVRYDLGSTWAVQEQIRYKDLKHGIGAVVSFDTPIGPADFSVGRSFLLKNEPPKNPLVWGDILFYFSIGYEVNL